MSTSSAGQISFFFNGHNNVIEEIAKFRAARRMWYRLMTERFGAKDGKPRSCSASTPRPAAPRCSAQQPEANIVPGVRGAGDRLL